MLLNADIGILQALGFEFELHKYALVNTLQWELDLREPDLRKIFFPKSGKKGTFWQF